MNMHPRHIEAIRQCADALRAEIGDDADTLLDTLDGETDALDALDSLLDARSERLTNARICRERIKALQERVAREAAGAEAITAQIGTLLDAIGERTIRRPLGTVTRTKARQSVEITDADQLPQGFFRTERKPLAKEIGEALKAGEAVPGATLKEGAPGVMVRV